MYTYVNILYSVNKELNWIELNMTIKKGLNLHGVTVGLIVPTEYKKLIFS